MLWRNLQTRAKIENHRTLSEKSVPVDPSIDENFGTSDVPGAWFAELVHAWRSTVDECSIAPRPRAADVALEEGIWLRLESPRNGHDAAFYGMR